MATTEFNDYILRQSVRYVVNAPNNSMFIWINSDLSLITLALSKEESTKSINLCSNVWENKNGNMVWLVPRKHLRVEPERYLGYCFSDVSFCQYFIRYPITSEEKRGVDLILSRVR